MSKTAISREDGAGPPPEGYEELYDSLPGWETHELVCLAQMQLSHEDKVRLASLVDRHAATINGVVSKTLNLADAGDALTKAVALIEDRTERRLEALERAVGIRETVEALLGEKN